MKVSRRTTAALARAIDEFAHDDMRVLVYEFELEEYMPAYTQTGLDLVRAIETRYGDDEARKILIELSERIMRARSKYEYANSDIIALLVSGLQLDSLAFLSGHITPTTPEPAVLAPQLSALEIQLKDRGLVVAVAHYQQASDCFARGNYEACNGQVRPFVENLAIELCRQVTGREFNNPSAAFQHLHQTHLLEAGEYNICRGFWEDIQDNGPHHGLSSDQEAIFRLHTATALGRYLLWRLPARPGAA